MRILGIAALYHDSSACIIENGDILSAVQEERFTRTKHDPSLPVNSINYCLKAANTLMKDLEAVVFYENPIKKLDRVLACIDPSQIQQSHPTLRRIENLLAERIWIEEALRDEFGKIGKNDELSCVDHHVSHAASAFYPSPFDEAAVLTIDGVGEWATTTIGYGSCETLKLLKQQTFPHSLGLLYSTFTSYCGFKVNSGEYKLMGLAPYGTPDYYEKILTEIISVNDDGSFSLNLSKFDFIQGEKMFNDKFCEVFGRPARVPETKYEQHYLNVAASIQKVTEEIVLKLAATAQRVTGSKKLVMAGGVALNCVANGKLLRSSIFDKIWIQPASGDAGGALGAALFFLHKHKKFKRRRKPSQDSMKGAFLGPSFTSEDVKRTLDEYGCSYDEYSQRTARNEIIAGHLAAGKVIGLFQGRMEFGPRSLGNRSIIADPRKSDMQSRMNLQIKNRESFRPFAPSVLMDKTQNYFQHDGESPYMLLVANVNEDRCIEPDQSGHADKSIYTVVNEVRSDIPAVTHVDFSARLHTVDPEINRDFYDIISAFNAKTACPVVINTSFNIRGEPIVCTPNDAVRCFFATDMDLLVLENYILTKQRQPLSLLNLKRSYIDGYELD